MYETVKTVKGYDIYRMVGTQRFYEVDIKKIEVNGKIWKQTVHFHTIKAAAKYIEEQL